MLPGVSIKVGNGNLGAVAPSADGVAGLICSGVATAEMPLLTPKVVYQLDDLSGLNVTDANNPSLYRHVKEFYSTAGNGATLYIMLVANTLSMTDCLDVANDYAKKLCSYSGGSLRLLGITRNPADSYVPTITNGLDADVYSAIVKGQGLGMAQEALFAPLSVLVEGRAFTGVAADLKDLRTGTSNRVSVVLASTVNDGSSSVGLALGRLAKDPVMRNMGRVKSGALPITSAYIGANSVDTYSGISAIHDKGYITIRKYVGRDGYYFTDDPTAVVATDDYANISLRRVIDKAIRITYNTYVDEVLDEVEIAEDGTIAVPVVKSMEGMIENAIGYGMAGEISSHSAYIDTNQNVISTGKTEIELSIMPVGYKKQIVVKLGFSNPAKN